MSCTAYVNVNGECKDNCFQFFKFSYIMFITVNDIMVMFVTFVTFYTIAVVNDRVRTIPEKLPNTR